MRGWVRQVAVNVVLFGVFVEVASRLALATPGFLARVAHDTASGRKVSSLVLAGDQSLGALTGTGGFVGHPVMGWTGGPWSSDAVNVGPDGRRWTHAPDRPPADGVLRVTLLGDSFVFGDEVPDEESFAWLLAERTGWDVQNLGVVGYGLDQAWLRWREEAKGEGSDVVVLGMSGVTALRVGRSWDSWAKPLFSVDDEGQLQASNLPIPDADALRLRPWSSRALLLGEVWWERWTRPRDHEMAAAPVVAAIVRQLEAEVQADGGRLVLAWLPIDAEYRPDPFDVTRGYWSVFRDLCAEGRVCVDLLPAFRADVAAGVTITRGAHWTPRGHEIVAEGLISTIRAVLPVDDAPPSGDAGEAGDVAER